MSEFSNRDAEDLDGREFEARSKNIDHDGEENDDLEDDLEEDQGDLAQSKFDPTPPIKLQQSIERLDALLLESVDDEKIRAGMGIRMALGMAQELKYGLPLGTETGELVQGWVLTYGQENVDAAVAIARQFLVKPGDMRKALGQRLGLGDET